MVSDDSDNEVDIDGDDILSSARKRKPEQLALPEPRPETKPKRSKKHSENIQLKRWWDLKNS